MLLERFRSSLIVMAAFIALDFAPTLAETYFGVRLESHLILPAGGVQIGYVFDNPDHPGAGRFGVRASITTFLTLTNRFTICGLYHASSAFESGFYLGAGAGLTLLRPVTLSIIPGEFPPDPNAPPRPVEFYLDLHGLIGYEWRLNESNSFFLELQIGVVFGLTVAVTTPAPALALGWNTRF
jgi:hypothetical protein